MKKTETVKLLVLNVPGVLGRVVARIRNEGWNIKRLHVDELEDGKYSEMEIEIEGTHNKLAQVVQRMLSIEWIMRICHTEGGEEVVIKRSPSAPVIVQKKQAVKNPQKPAGAFRILTINPGSTSTKYGLYDDEKEVFVETIRHGKDELEACGSVTGQKDLRRACIRNAVLALGIDPETIDAVSGRGGLIKPIESGTYIISAKMLSDLNNATASIHASALGAIIAADISEELGIPAYVVDPIVVDELDRHAKLTGMPGLYRSSVFHALNQKAIARRHAAKTGAIYENSRYIICHLGGGISIGAHRYGRVIDVNDALTGEGPFTPERTGSIPVLPVIRMCFSGEYTEKEMTDRIVKTGGMQGYLGTNDLKTVQRLIDDGDEFAALVMDSMAYQVSKEIGAMTAVLEGRVDAVLLTGGLAFSNRFTAAIKQRVDRLAPVYVYPGEDEMLALMQGALRVLRGEEAAKQYDC